MLNINKWTLSVHSVFELRNWSVVLLKSTFLLIKVVTFELLSVTETFESSSDAALASSPRV